MLSCFPSPRSTSQYYSRANPNFYSPVIEIDDDSHSRFITDSQKKSHVEDGEDSEAKREEFRHPRNCLLNFAADFYKLCSGKLNEINKVWLPAHCPGLGPPAQTFFSGK